MILSISLSLSLSTTLQESRYWWYLSSILLIWILKFSASSSLILAILSFKWISSISCSFSLSNSLFSISFIYYLSYFFSLMSASSILYLSLNVFWMLAYFWVKPLLILSSYSLFRSSCRFSSRFNLSISLSLLGSALDLASINSDSSRSMLLSSDYIFYRYIFLSPSCFSLFFICNESFICFI